MGKMDLDSFKSWAAGNILSHLPAGYKNAKVELHRIERPGAPYTGLTVLKEGQTDAAVVDLEKMYELYRTGISEEELLAGMARIAVMTLPVQGEFCLRSYEDAKKRVCMRLMNLDANTGLLAKVPHRIIEDMALTYHVITGMREGDIWSAIITNGIAEDWGVSEDELHSSALMNSPLLFPARLDRMSSMIGCDTEAAGGPELMVLSNSGGFYGASAVLYPGVLEMAEEEIGEEFYIIPSSVNEMILVPGTLVDDPVQLLRTHRFVSSQTEPADRLSACIFRFDPQSGKLECASGAVS